MQLSLCTCFHLIHLEVMSALQPISLKFCVVLFWVGLHWATSCKVSMVFWINALKYRGDYKLTRMDLNICTMLNHYYYVNCAKLWLVKPCIAKVMLYTSEFMWVRADLLLAKAKRSVHRPPWWGGGVERRKGIWGLSPAQSRFYVNTHTNPRVCGEEPKHV
jgi:hypothetical protein